MVNKIGVLIWKDLLMRKNHYIFTVLEAFLPFVIIIFTNLTLPKYEPEINANPMSFGAPKDDQCVLRHSHYGQILYEPSNPFIDKLMQKAACYAGYKKSSVKAGRLDDNSSYFSIGVKFEGINDFESQIPDHIQYSLYPTSKVWANVLSLWRFSEFYIPRYNVPSLYSVVEFQRAIDVSYMQMKNLHTVKLNFENMDLFSRNPSVFAGLIYLALFIAFTLMVPPIIRRIVEEKFTGAKELMLMMGVERWQLWLAKFLDVLFMSLLSVSGMVIFLYVPLKEDSNILKIPPLLFWGVISYGLIGVIFFLFFLSCFFEKASFAVYVTQMIWCFSFVFNNFISSIVELPHFVKWIIFFLPHVTLMNGVSILLDFDLYDKPVQLTERLSGKQDYLSLSEVLIMMTLNMILYLTLTWYLDLVKPGKYGVPQPYGFCFKSSYWKAKKVNFSNENACNGNQLSNCFESVPTNLPIGVSIQNVCKVYQSSDKGPVTAVDDVSINFYHSEISALLGHNGAGKTTMFSIITGMTYPTSGKVLINGYDVGVNICEARRSLGLCPQQDMLFNDLTTLQILKFYGLVKGLTLSKARKEANELIKKLKLDSVKNTQASKLSGGQKRKVSLAIALIGGSEVLVLDEPTSGMDPEIRREIWEILLNLRGTRTILLTTHFMEEADALCDRIAIMDHGKVKCYGSPMYLKRKYGKGYLLSIVGDVDNVKELTDYIKEFISTAKFKSQNVRTLCYELPESEVANFPNLFYSLDKKQSQNEITSYGISLTTLEEVFLRLKYGDEEINFDTTDSPHYKNFDNGEELIVSKVSGYFLYFYQYWALIVKKWIFFKRSLKSFLIYTVLSTFLVLLMHYYSHINTSQNKIGYLSSTKSLTFTPSLYSPFLALYSNHDEDNVGISFEAFMKNMNASVQEVEDIKQEVLKIFKRDFYTYVKELNLAVDFSPEEINIFHNEEAVHMVPIALNLIHNFLLKLKNVDGHITTSVNLKYSDKDLFIIPRLNTKCVLDDLPDLSSSQALYYLLSPSKEHFYGAKEIQLMSTPSFLYWLSHFSFDIISFILYMVVITFGIGLSQNDDFMLQHADEIFVSLLFWGTGLILIAYVISVFIKNLTASFTVSMIIYIVCTFILYNVIAFDGLPKFFQYLHPTCILKFGYLDLCSGKESNYVLALFLYNAVLFSFLIVNDKKLLNRMFHSLCNRFARVDYSLQEDKDTFVRDEEEAVKKIIDQKGTSDAVLIVDQLKRWYLKGYKSFPAVRGVSFKLNQGECFGLLGVNGAGKTSTFKMLIGTLSPSHGNTYVCSVRMSGFNRLEYLRQVGYCPQFGGLIPSFKGMELLQLFARLRGLHRSQVDEEARKWLEKLNLWEFAGQKCGTYSGGNQRKLSTAISFIGDCPLIFLDEPTSGVDPLSRRSIWNVVGEVQKEGQSIVLTSHSMDECEALCTRLAIMVNGRFRCIGETTTLKDRFGHGYCVQLKLSNGAADETVYALKKSFVTNFDPGCNLIDEHLTILQYHVTNKLITWADLFTKLKNLKDTFDILESYTASATTLEQIFIYLARNG